MLSVLTFLRAGSAAHTVTKRRENPVERYQPDFSAPLDGTFDWSSGEPRWRRAHDALMQSALQSWKGWPATMRIHMYDEMEGAPLPGSGSGKQMRAEAAALLWELEHRSTPSPKPLYRGSHLPPRGRASRRYDGPSRGEVRERSVPRARVDREDAVIHPNPPRPHWRLVPVHLKKGATLYHGTAERGRFSHPRGPAWFTNEIWLALSFALASSYGKLTKPDAQGFGVPRPRGLGKPRVLEYRVRESIPMLRMTRDRLDAEVGFVGYLEGLLERDLYFNTYDAAQIMCTRGYQGWLVKHAYQPREWDIVNEPTADDVMICDPRRWLVRVS